MTAEALEEMRARGMRDLLPAEMDRVRLVEDSFATACRLWGYREIRTPVIEPLHLFTAAGTLSPKMLDTVYSFLDWDGWSGERVVLRPDSTIPAARLYGERYGEGIAKLFYRQNIFRFTDDGSSREEWQCGVELIGDTGVSGDVELLMLALETLTPLGLPQVTVRVSHAGIVRAVLGAAGLDAAEQSRAYDRLLDGDLSVVGEIEASLPQLNAPLHLLFDVEGAGSAYIANLRAGLCPSIPALQKPLDELAFSVEALEVAGVAPRVHAVLARSFEYYSGMVFKLYVDDERICSGGRYDGLIETIGDTGVPASGFAHYLSPLVSRLQTTVDRPSNVRVVVDARDLAPKQIAATISVARALREAGFEAESTKGYDSQPTHWLVLAEDEFRLLSKGVDETFAALEGVIARLESSR